MMSSRNLGHPGDARVSRRDGLAEIIARAAAEHRLQLEICASLDKLAGHRPLTSDLELVRLLARVLEPSFVEHADLQERLVFPLISGRYSAVDPVQHVLAHFAHEHRKHFETTRAAAAMLGAVVQGSDVDGAALRALLGAVNDERRRHIDTERALLDELMPASVTPIERVRLEAILWGRAWPRLGSGQWLQI